MQMKKNRLEEKGSMAVYVSIVLLAFFIILSGIFVSSISVRKNQLKTVLMIKQSYELYNENVEEIYQKQLAKVTISYVADGLILHYDGIDNTGSGHSTTATTWKDLSGNGNDGTLSKSLDSSSFYWGDNNITLSGVSSTLGTYVDTPLNLNGQERTIIYTIDGTGLTGSIWGDTSSSNTNGLFNYYTFVANRGSSTSSNNKYTYTFAKSGIYQYAVTLSTSEMKFYENGELKETLSNTIGLTTTNNLRVLAAYYSSQNATNLKMYNFMVYNRALTDSEITQNYQIDKSKYGF